MEVLRKLLVCASPDIGLNDNFCLYFILEPRRCKKAGESFCRAQSETEIHRGDVATICLDTLT